ncbi:MAG TPA: malto-oligosyltrehalose synthase, partial [Burkholderiales bacterium]|nr:malto-oligosyltrehalose synthase [Burkholderiales bacterium]
IDHVDGLFDPAAYCRRLQDRFRTLRGPSAVELAADRQRWPLYVITEKIIASFEDMPQNWGVYGTTGYRFANVVNGLFVDSAAERRFTRIYQNFIGDDEPFDEIAVRGKHLIMRGALASELMVLANRLARIAHANRNTRDYTVNTLRQALAEIIARFPVYRTYIANDIAESDRRYIDWAVALAKRHSRAADISIFDFIKSVLLSDPASPSAPPAAAAMRMFARKFQQVTAPVMAKGVEDTAFYVFNRLVSLNDVGGEPNTFGVTVSAFHGASADRATNWPATMLATSTHDNKRSEDVRARIDVLSEFAAGWQLQLRRWARMNRSKKREVDGEPAPSRNDEYLLYQTLVGTFPPAPDADMEAYRDRIERYMLKAVREAKVHTSWITNHEAYESAVTNFVRSLLTPGKSKLFLENLRTAIEPLTWIGVLNSVSMMLIKYTSPGVPDCYQGNEFFDFSLVDPDNRRPVDYAARREALSGLGELLQHLKEPDAGVQALFDGAPDNGRAKLYVIWRLLRLRRARPSVFMHGGYLPLVVTGERAPHVVAYARRYAGRGVITIAGRMFGGLGITPRMMPCGEAVWGDTRVSLPFLGEGTVLRDVFTGASRSVTAGGIRLADAHDTFPG